MALGLVIAAGAIVVGVGTIAAVTARRAITGDPRKRDRRNDGAHYSDGGEVAGLWSAGGDSGSPTSHHKSEAMVPDYATTQPSSSHHIDTGDSGGGSFDGGSSDGGSGGGDGGGGGGGD